jgi:hypothetical protein
MWTMTDQSILKILLDLSKRIEELEEKKRKLLLKYKLSAFKRMKLLKVQKELKTLSLERSRILWMRKK